ncbi:MAG: Crp/Fnr family transcriptional regulator [Oscillospiraceae bacterium]
MDEALRTELAGFLPFWKHLNDADRAYLEANTMCVAFGKGALLHSGEADCIGVLLIRSGSLCTSLLSEEGREIMLFRLGAGEVCILAASCVIEQITFDVQITTESPTELIVINAHAYKLLCERNVYVESFTFKSAVDRFSDVMWTMQQILFKGFDRRLASYLYDETVRLSGDTVRETHEDIARHTGSAREVVSRMLTRFADDGIVSLSRGAIKITDRAKLKALL